MVHGLSQIQEKLVLYPWTDEYRNTYFPIRLEYSTTLQKVQGPTLADVPCVEAAAHVALSRVEYDDNWRYNGNLTPMHFVPELKIFFLAQSSRSVADAASQRTAVNTMTRVCDRTRPVCSDTILIWYGTRDM